MNLRKKRCSKCKRHLNQDKFNKSVKSKDGKGNYCKQCNISYQIESRKRTYESNPPLQLLKSSCQAAYRRSQSNYVKDGYAHVTTNYESVKTFWTDLWADDSFRENWIKQSLVYEASGMKRDRPTLDRIDPTQGYVKDNLQVLPYWKNVLEGALRECEVYVIRNLRLEEKLNFKGVGEAKKDLINRYKVPVNVLNQVDHGTVINVSDGIGLLIQTTKGNLKDDEHAKYRMVFNHSKIMYDLETGIKVIRNHYQFQLDIRGIEIRGDKTS